MRGLNVVEIQSMDPSEVSERAKMRWDFMGGEIEMGSEVLE